ERSSSIALAMGSVASCLAEHQHSGPAIGLTLDGAGYGTDATVWGGEVLIGDAARAMRFALE
ncbi:hypothetical protein, partial [Proteus mirabilis]|uniref:Kae1-like domain-containing protein n=1 Tax=Proteus mirabilis TaxID=584 RepID=UPI00195346AD